MAKPESVVAHTRALSFIVPQDSTIEFYGSKLCVRVRYREAEKPEYLHFRAVDITHWVRVAGGADRYVLHSAQMQEWLQNLAKRGELLGFLVSDEDGRRILEVGNMGGF